MNRRQVLCAATGVLASAFARGARADQFGADNAPIRITLQMQPTQSPKSSVPSVKEYYQTHMDAWAKAHPDVLLDVSFNSTDINASMTRMQEQASTGRAPDAAMIDSFFVNRFYQYLQPLDAYYGPDQVNESARC